MLFEGKAHHDLTTGRPRTSCPLCEYINSSLVLPTEEVQRKFSLRRDASYLVLDTHKAFTIRRCIGLRWPNPRK
jgi:hypothetical protein